MVPSSGSMLRPIAVAYNVITLTIIRLWQQLVAEHSVSTAAGHSWLVKALEAEAACCWRCTSDNLFPAAKAKHKLLLPMAVTINAGTPVSSTEPATIQPLPGSSREVAFLVLTFSQAGMPLTEHDQHAAVFVGCLVVVFSAPFFPSMCQRASLQPLLGGGGGDLPPALRSRGASSSTRAAGTTFGASSELSLMGCDHKQASAVSLMS